MSTTTELRVHRVETPLFDGDGPHESVFGAFSEGRTERIHVDQAGLELLALELGLDPEGLFYCAQHYLGGEMRLKSPGLSGGLLGEFAEALTLLWCKHQGMEVVSVPPSHVRLGENRGRPAPEPSFLELGRGGIRLIDVVAEQAMDFQHYRGDFAWRWIHPCTRVAPHRTQAVERFRTGGGEDRSGDTPDFPTDSVAAMSVLLLDGRIRGLLRDPRLKTPKACRASGRSCWGCLGFETTSAGDEVLLLPEPGRGNQATMTWMQRAEDDAPMLPSGRMAIPFFHSFRRWTQAIWAWDRGASRETAEVLGSLVARWIDGLEVDEPRRDRLRRSWYRYLRSTSRQSGIRLGPLALSDLDDESPPDDDIDEQTIETVSLEPAAHPGWWSTVDARRFSYRRRTDYGVFDFAVADVGNVPRMRCLSDAWCRLDPIRSEAEALAVASTLIEEYSLGTRTLWVEGLTGMIPTIARVEDSDVQLGWVGETVLAYGVELDTPVRMANGQWIVERTVVRVVRVTVLPDGRAGLRLLNG